VRRACGYIENLPPADRTYVRVCAVGTSGKRISVYISLRTSTEGQIFLRIFES
jgi:hypothetical protein